MEVILILIAAAAYGLLAWRTALLIGAFCAIGEREDERNG